MTKVRGWRRDHSAHVVRTDGYLFSRKPFSGPAMATPFWVHRLKEERSYITSALARRIPETPKVKTVSGTPKRSRRAFVGRRGTCTMSLETIGHQVTVIGPFPNESLTTSLPLRNATG